MKLLPIVWRAAAVAACVGVATALARPEEPAPLPAPVPAPAPAPAPVHEEPAPAPARESEDPTGEEPAPAAERHWLEKDEAELTPEELKRVEEFVQRYQRAQQLFGSGRDAEAEKIYRELLEIHDGIAEIHHSLAYVLRFQGRQEEATAEFMLASKLSPQDAVMARDAGQDLLDLGRVAEAEPYFARSVTLSAEDLESLLGHGHVLRQLGRLEEAQARYRAAIALEPKSVDAGISLAASLVKTAPDESLEILAGLPGHYPDAALAKGRALESLGRTEDARTQLRKLAELAPAAPSGVPFFRDAANALIRLADVDGSLLLAKKWTEFDRNEKGIALPAAACLALCEAAAGDFDASIAALDASREPQGLPMEIGLHLAFFRASVRLQQGRDKDAEAILDQLAGVERELFEVAAAKYLRGKITAKELASGDWGALRANDVAWVEYLGALQSGDSAAAEEHRLRALELSSPPGEYPAIMLQSRPAAPKDD